MATDKFFGKKDKKLRVDSNLKTELSMPIEKKTNFTKEHRSDQSIDIIRKFSEISEDEEDNEPYSINRPSPKEKNLFKSEINPSKHSGGKSNYISSDEFQSDI